MRAFVRDLVRTVIPRGLRNWLRSPGLSLRWLWDEAAYRVGHCPELDLRPGLRLRCHPAAHRFWRANQIEDPDQAAEFDAFLAACGPEVHLFDLGAHFGLFSLAATARGPFARAVAVDPSPASVAMIHLGARLNAREARVIAIEAAVGAEQGTVQMLDVGVQAAGYFVVATSGRSRRDVREARVVTVDDLTERFGPPTLLKIDVEGAEAEALRGARATLRAGSPPAVFLELHGRMMRERGARPEDALAELLDAGYALHDLAGAPRAVEWATARDLVRLIARRIVR